MTELEITGRWLSAVLVLGWLGMPLAVRLFPSLPDRGLPLARPLALLLVTYVAWLAAALHLLPFATAVYFLAAPGLALVAVAAAFGRRRRDAGHAAPASERLVHTIVHEVIFVAAFAGFAWLRGYTPDILATEKPMELMLLNASLNASGMPPADGWMAGQTVNYYYLGYVAAAVLALLSQAPVGYAFNLTLTTIVALCVSGASSLAINLWVQRTPRTRPRLLAALPVGLLAAYLLVAAGNLVAGLAWLRNPAETSAASWWGGIGWRSSRILVDQLGSAPWEDITEFPWFSFILGDLHPHVLALPFTVLALGLALDWWFHSPLADVLARRPTGWLRLALGALIVGWLYAVNSWDLPLHLGLTLLALTRPAWFHGLAARSVPEVTPMEGELAPVPWRWPVVAVGLAFVALAAGVMLPFTLTFTSFAGNQGIRLPEPWQAIPAAAAIARVLGVVTWERTSADEFLNLWGAHATAVAAWLWYRYRAANLPLGNAVALLLVGAALLGLLLGSAPTAAGLATLAVVGLLVRQHALSAAESFVVLLVAISAALLVSTEFFFLQDVFANRMNTIFKVYYQVWLLLSLVVALGTAEAVAHLWRALVPGDRSRPTGSAIAVGLAVVVTVVLTAGYPLIASPARADRFERRAGLDGLGFLADHPDERAALAWLATHAPRGAVVAEDPGNSYGEFGGVPHGRAATIAGTRAPLVWPGHEQQWRANQPAVLAEIGPRLLDMQTLYGSTDVAAAGTIIERYAIEFVYVGAWERAADARRGSRQPVYTPEALAKFDAFMDVAFRQGEVTIYRRRAK